MWASLVGPGELLARYGKHRTQSSSLRRCSRVESISTGRQDEMKISQVCSQLVLKVVAEPGHSRLAKDIGLLHNDQTILVQFTGETVKPMAKF